MKTLLKRQSNDPISTAKASWRLWEDPFHHSSARWAWRVWQNARATTRPREELLKTEMILFPFAKIIYRFPISTITCVWSPSSIPPVCYGSICSHYKQYVITLVIIISASRRFRSRGLLPKLPRRILHTVPPIKPRKFIEFLLSTIFLIVGCLLIGAYIWRYRLERRIWLMTILCLMVGCLLGTVREI